MLVLLQVSRKSTSDMNYVIVFTISHHHPSPPARALPPPSRKRWPASTPANRRGVWPGFYAHGQGKSSLLECNICARWPLGCAFGRGRDQESLHADMATGNFASLFYVMDYIRLIISKKMLCNRIILHKIN